jgi:hypothetical protein
MDLSMNQDFPTAKFLLMLKFGFLFLMFGWFAAPELFAGAIKTTEDAKVKESLSTVVWVIQWICWIGGAIAIIAGIFRFNDGKQKEGIIMILFGALVAFKLFSWMEPHIPKAGNVGGAGSQSDASQEGVN